MTRKEYLRDLLYGFFKSHAKVKLWLETSNPNLGNVPPKVLLKAGRVEKLIKFVESRLAENEKESE